jgi:hypothetical protein
MTPNPTITARLAKGVRLFLESGHGHRETASRLEVPTHVVEAIAAGRAVVRGEAEAEYTLPRQELEA